jgi:hypothetical protein
MRTSLIKFNLRFSLSSGGSDFNRAAEFEDHFLKSIPPLFISYRSWNWISRALDSVFAPDITSSTYKSRRGTAEAREDLAPRLLQAYVELE